MGRPSTLRRSLRNGSDGAARLERALGPLVPTEGPLQVAGLFAGIGGIELGLERYQHSTNFLCEIDEGARSVLEKKFPGVRLTSDVRDLPPLPRGTDLLAAGFPCQDLSQVGPKTGITGAQSSLVGHVFELLRRRRIPWVLIENVPFMLQLERGRALNVIVQELEALGYRWAYRVVDANAFGLPQRRERVFLLASRVGDPWDVLLADDSGPPESTEWSRGRAFGFYWTEGNRGLGAAVDAVPTLKGGSGVAVVLPHPHRRIVTPGIRDAERLQGFPEEWTVAAQRRARQVGHRWKLVGNAVNVRASQWIGYRLRRPSKYERNSDPELRRGSRWPRSAWGEGGRRFTASASGWPVRIESPHLHEFLKDPADLSEKATAGFRRRLLASSLKRPDWFEGLLDSHICRMRRAKP